MLFINLNLSLAAPLIFANPSIDLLINSISLIFYAKVSFNLLFYLIKNHNKLKKKIH